MPLIKCENLTLGYEGKTVISNLGFEINQGNYMCIVGPNGSGKSTLVHSLLGLKKPASGKISFGDGLEKNSMGYLPQQIAMKKDFPVSVKEVVMSGIRCGKRLFFTSADRKTAEEKMEFLGIRNLASSPFSELSGGQRQRVLLARALCSASDMLLLDEPTAGLDPLVTEQLYELILKINESGVTVLMVSHDLSASLKYASHILHLAHDSIFFGTTAEYLDSEIGKSYIENSAVSFS